jgi:hypothetical protein
LGNDTKRCACRSLGWSGCAHDADIVLTRQRRQAAGWEIGSGMVASACKHLIGAREKGPGMRWSETVAQTVAQTVAAVRVLLLNDQWSYHNLAA